MCSLVGFPYSRDTFSCAENTVWDMGRYLLKVVVINCVVLGKKHTCLSSICLLYCEDLPDYGEQYNCAIVVVCDVLTATNHSIEVY